MISITVTHDLQRVVGWAKWVAADQVPFALARALTRTALQVRDAERVAMAAEMDRPTRFTLNALFVRPALKNRPEAVVWLKDTGDSAARQYLATQITGGRRAPKRFERALAGAGLMPSGWVAVAARDTERDAAGNVPSKLIVQLLSYLNAFSEQGYSANMTDKRRGKLAKAGKTADGYATINGVRYFVSKGPGNFSGKGSWKHGRSQHLAAGIWAKSGTHGSNVRPVFLFVPKATYKPRFTFEETAARTINANLIANWRESWRDALASKRLG